MYRVTTFAKFSSTNIINEQFFANFEEAKNACIGNSNLYRSYNFNEKIRYKLIGYSINGNYFSK